MKPDIAGSAARSMQARARIRPHVYETPLLPAARLHDELGSSLLFKAENFQRSGSFKIRGAAAKMSSLPAGERLITASSGNHGIAASLAARSLGQQLTVVLPENVTAMKLEKIRSFGVEVIVDGADAGLSERRALRRAKERDLTYVSPYNDPEIIAGQGTIGLELLEQCPDVDNVFVCMGGGGLISGIGSVLKSFHPRARLYGVAAANSQALAVSMKAGRIVETEHLETLADGVAGGVDEDSMTLDIARAVVDEIVVCREAEIVEALRDLTFKENLLVEGAAALTLAGLKKVADKVRGQTNAVVLCGANFDREKVFAAIFA